MHKVQVSKCWEVTDDDGLLILCFRELGKEEESGFLDEDALHSKVEMSYRRYIYSSTQPLRSPKLYNLYLIFAENPIGLGQFREVEEEEKENQDEIRDRGSLRDRGISWRSRKSVIVSISFISSFLT